MRIITTISLLGASFVLILFGLLALLTGGDSASVSRGANGDCVRAWNAAGNAGNQSAAANSYSGWPVVFGEFVVGHAGSGQSGNDLTGEGCSYFLYSSKRWKSYSGTWEADGDLRWGVPQTTSGERTPEQQIPPPFAVLGPHAKLVRIPIDRGGPVSDREWKAVINDWYDNGEFDRGHRCAAVREATRRLPSSMPSYSSVFDDLRRYSESVC